MMQKKAGAVGATVLCAPVGAYLLYKSFTTQDEMPAGGPEASGFIAAEIVSQAVIPAAGEEKAVARSGEVLAEELGPAASDVAAEVTTAVERHGDFNGPWRELDPKFNWGRYLKEATGTAPPGGMVRPHAHHGVFKQGRPGEQRALVEQAQDIIRRRAGIDPIYGLENLGWAPNRGHTTAVARDFTQRLLQLDAANGTPEDFAALLQTLLKEAQAR